MELNKYHDKNNQLLKNLYKLMDVYQATQMVQAIRQTNEIITRLESDTFKLLIVGEFSRGKSTFVNALLGRKILPSSKNPTTAIISKIVYGEQPDYHIFYRDEAEPRRLSEAEFIKLTAPKEPDENDLASVQEYIRVQEELDKIDFAQITYPLPFCQNGVEVVDTPGTNDLNTVRLDITYGYLAKADAVVLLLSATQPLSASEAEFLRERILGNQIQDIFFVISRKDELDGPEQEQSVVDFITENLRKILPKEISLKNRIFLVSSRGALIYHINEQGGKLTMKQEMELPENFAETGFTAFEETLGNFLAEEKGMVRLRKHRREALSIIRTVQNDLSRNIAIAAHSADEIRVKAASLQGQFQQAKQRADKIVSSMRLSLDNEVINIDLKCRNAGQDILSAARSAVDDIEKYMSVSAMQQIIQQAAMTKKKQFMDSMLKDWQTVFSRETEAAQKKLASIWQDIDVAYQSSFNLPTVSEKEKNISIEGAEKNFADEAFDVAEVCFRDMFSSRKSVGDRVANGIFATLASTAGVVSKIWGFFSGGQQDNWRDKIRNQVVSAYCNEGDHLSEAFVMQYRDRVEELCRQVQESVDVRIGEMEAQLQNIISEKEAIEHDAKVHHDMLMEKQKELQSLAKELNSRDY
ncbi:MAG: dynamin family protein [Butyrivibrio sp.]|nr:dynamin family protein [Butyrivibrio sp.]